MKKVRDEAVSFPSGDKRKRGVPSCDSVSSSFSFSKSFKSNAEVDLGNSAGNVHVSQFACESSRTGDSWEEEDTNKLVLVIEPPWDILRGRCVFKDRGELEREVRSSHLSHWAPNCATFSRAREIPLKNVKNPPKPVRSEIFPEGIPQELQSMSRKAVVRLKRDTEMAVLSAEMAEQTAAAGRKFTLEHPGRSLALHLPSWKRLMGREDVFVIFYHTCMFQGSRRKKHQVLITNEESFVPTMGRRCEGHDTCSRTGLPHLRWRPTVSGGRVVQFKTGDEREYPRGFCESYASTMKSMTPSPKSFVEVYSGPNAPLSQAVGREFSVLVPGERVDTKGEGVHNELQSLAQVLKGLHPENREMEAHALHPGESLEVESGFYRNSAVSSGRQPSYGKRHQLIPNEVCDPMVHLEKAMRLKHPFSSESAMKEDHLKSLKSMKKFPAEQLKERLNVLASWRVLATSQEVRSRQTHHETLASDNAKRIGRKPRTALMEVLAVRYSIEDRVVPRLLLEGMPIVGDALASKFFHDYEVPPSITMEELLKTAPMRRQNTIKRVKLMAIQGGAPMARAIWEKTQKEVASGAMSGPFSHKYLLSRLGAYYNVIPSFGLEQGVDDDGVAKYRRIDDHTAGHTNLAACRKQKIEMAMIDYLVVMIKSLSGVFSSPVVVATEDMKAAYRQIPLCDSHTAVSVTAIYNPDSDHVDLFQMHAQPFGAGHSVPNFYRVAEFLSRLMTRAYHLLLDHFFDDFFAALRPQEAESAMFCLRESFLLLGFDLDPSKSQPPAEIIHVLGVALNTSVLQSQKKLLVEPKPTRKTNIEKMISNILKSNCLTSNVAASLVGKFSFLCSSLFGKIGRCCTLALRQRQYERSEQTALTKQLKTSLQLMLHLMYAAPSRECLLNDKSAPLLLYTDASDIPDRIEGRCVLGAVLIVPGSSPTIYYTSYTVSSQVVSKWFPRQTYMGQLELLAAPLAICTWSHVLEERHILHFIDNDSAASNLVKGYSPLTDSAAIVGDYWLLAAQHKMSIYIDRVSSKANISDGPSRNDFSLLQSLNGIWNQPKDTFLTNRSFDWFVE